MFTRAFGVLASVGIVASVVGHLMKLAGVSGIDTFRWVATAAGWGALGAIAQGLAYQRFKRAHLRRSPELVPRALTPVGEQLRDELDERFVPLISSARVAAAVVALRRGGETDFRAYFDPRAALGLDERTVFEIGSITKTFTGLLLAQMTLAGEVELEEPLSHRLPELYRGRDQVPTLLDLATHRSGLPRLPLGMVPAVFARAPDPYRRWDEHRLLSGTRRTPSRSAPGTSTRYSNLGFSLLGLVLSRAAGERYGELVRGRICAPLGMDDTHVGASPAHESRLAPGHDYFGGKTANWNLAAFSPAGGIRSTAADMQHYLAAQLDPDATPFADAIRFAQKPRAEFRPKGLLATAAPPRRIGLAWITSQLDGTDEIVWHNGGTGGYGSFIGLQPASETGIVALTNSSHSRRLDKSCQQLLTSARAPAQAPEPRPSSAPSGDL